MPNEPICRLVACNINRASKAPCVTLLSKITITDLQSRQMGGICSKSSTLSGGHTLASPTPIDNSGRPQQQQQRHHQVPRQTAEARRGQAAAAAEQRMKAVRLVFCPSLHCPVL